MKNLESIEVKVIVAAFAFFAAGALHAKTLVQSQSQQNPTESRKSAAAPQRGKKLVLKDGSFQLTREYQRTGDRVRYFSSERGDWEELPVSMIDWEATAKAEAAESKEEEALVKNVKKEELEKRRDVPLDVDASLPVAPGIFLPPGEGMFVVEGKSVTPLNQVGAEIRTDKKQLLKQVLSPVPIVPSKRNVEIPGAKSVRRINSDRPEFYLREAPPDPDAGSTIHRSGRLGDNGPDVELIRLVVKGGRREIESIRSLFGEKLSEDRNSISVQRWDIAQTVFRFTLNEDLPAGEYAFAEILPDGVNLYVWDFGVDRKAAAPAKK